MEIMISKRMRKLRSGKKNTQEQLAAHLGITVQAVSKWERGEGYPDISLLPAIAAFYNVTVDSLLGVDEVEKQKKLDAYASESAKLTRSGKVSECVHLWRNAYREFPNEPSVLHNLAWSLRSENLQEHAEEIMALSKRLLKEATQSGEYFGAINSLCRICKIQGDMESARQYASKAGRYIGTENQLMIHILEGDDAADYCKWNIETLVDLIAVNAGVMLQKGTFTTAEKIHISERIIELFSLIYEDGNFGFYHCRISKWSMTAAKAYANAQRKDEALLWLLRATKHAKAYDALENGHYTAPLVKGANYSSSRGAQSQLQAMQADMADSCFDFLRDDPQFAKLLTP